MKNDVSSAVRGREGNGMNEAVIFPRLLEKSCIEVNVSKTEVIVFQRVIPRTFIRGETFALPE